MNPLMIVGLILGGVGLIAGTIATEIFDDKAEEERRRAQSLEELFRESQRQQAQRHAAARAQALERALQNPHLDPRVRLQLLALLLQTRPK